MKKVLQISKYYYPEVGGIERMASAITKAVQGKYEMKILCFASDSKDVSDNYDGIEIVRAGITRKVFSQPIAFSYIRLVKKVINEYQPDYIIIHEPNPFASFFLLNCIRDKCILIVYWHSDIIRQKRLEVILRNYYYRLLERADAIIATSFNYLQGSDYLQKYKSKCSVIPKCIDEELLCLNKESKELADRIREKYRNKIICVGVGRMVPYKGFEFLAEASKLVDDRFVFFVIGRKGDSTDRIKSIVGSQENFVLLENLSDWERNAYFAASDIITFPSITKNEAFGIGLAEGMYFGKPAITFEIPGSGVGYVNKNGVSGIEVDNRDVKAYSDALLKLADDDKLRMTMGNAARERIVKKFLFSKFKESLLDLLEQI